jgi:hypothetical protein
MNDDIKEVELIDFDDNTDVGKFKILLKNDEIYFKKCPRGYYKKTSDGSSEYFVANNDFWELLKNSKNVKK